MAETENLSEDDLQAEKDAAKYFSDTHPESKDHDNIYANMPIEDNTIEKKDESAPEGLVEGSSAAGALGSYKGFGTKLLKPGEGVFKPSNVQPRPPVSSAPYQSRVEPTFNMGNESPLSHVDPYDTEVDRIMQSISEKENPTGRQRERGHNWETNRESLATKGNLDIPGAKQAIVEAGPYTPTRSGIAIPEHTARDIEDERIRKMAQDRIAQEQAEQAAEQAKGEKKLAEENAKVQAELAQRKAEEKAASSGKVLGIGKGIAKVGLGALGGGFAGKDFWDAYHEYKKHGYSDEAISKLMQGIGGSLMVVPTPFTEGLGAATIGAGMAYPTVHKYIKKHM